MRRTPTDQRLRKIFQWTVFGPIWISLVVLGAYWQELSGLEMAVGLAAFLTVAVGTLFLDHHKNRLFRGVVQRPAVLSLLVRWGEEETAWLWAAELGHEDWLRARLVGETRPESRWLDELGLLRWAAKQGHLKTIELLLDAGVDLEHRDEFDQTVLYGVAEQLGVGRALMRLNGRKAVRGFPLDHPADPGGLKRIEEVRDLLLERGADVLAQPVAGPSLKKRLKVLEDGEGLAALKARPL